MARSYRYGVRNNDPHWITTRYPQQDSSGTVHPANTRAFYYPLTRRVLFGEEAEQAARDFEAARHDEEFMNGGD